MEYRTLGGTDLRVSSIGMGCVTFGREIDRDQSFAVLDRAFERGINLLDTAEAYANGASESVVGEWMESRGVRDRIVLATKVSGKLTAERVLSSASDSLSRLQTNCIDLFQLHVWDPETRLDETLAALQTLVQSGKVRHVGCSNWAAWQVAKSLLMCQVQDWVPLRCVQPPYNLVQREIESELLPLCADQGIGVLSYSPLAAGFLAGKYRRGHDVPTGTRFDVIPGHQPIYFTDHGFGILDRLDQLSQATGHSLVQLALAWALAQPVISSVLIGARNTAQVDQAFDAEAIAWDPDWAI